jgi:3',5'-cyclic AMP phosphodiesterase CpdA
MFRLAHLSDLHLALLSPASRRELMSKRITGYVNWIGNRGSRHQSGIVERLADDIVARAPDHVAVTGDLVNLSLDSEFAVAARFLTTLGPPDAVSAICGNHDAYVPGALAKALSQWAPFMTGDDAVPTGIGDFPYLRRRDGVSIIGCNSARATMPFMATGFFRKAQAERLAEILEREGKEGRCRVILIHHPPVRGITLPQKRLSGQSLFRAVVKRHGAELVLHGHTHRASVNRIAGRPGGVPVVGVPAAGQAPQERGRREAARYNIYAIAEGPKGWSIAMNEYGVTGAGLAISLVGKQQLI